MESIKKIIASCFFITVFSIGGMAEQIFIGKSIVDITPKTPVAVDGQMRLRVTENIVTPLEANILVLDSSNDKNSFESIVFVSLDLVTIPVEVRDLIRTKVKYLIPGFNIRKIILNATHTHTAPVVRKNWYKIPEKVIKVQEYLEFLSSVVANGIEEAWLNRKPGGVTWGINWAKVAFNRRSVFYDGSAEMWGDTNSPDFLGIEGYEDHSINTLFFWNEDENLIATCINIASPAQVLSSNSEINADYMHPLRVSLRNRFGKDLSVLGWIGAAGDMTPKPLYGLEPENRMFELQGLKFENARGADFTNEIARRIVRAVEDTYEIVKKDIRSDIKLFHKVENFDLPMRIVTENEYNEAKMLRDQDLSDPERSFLNYRRTRWNQEVMDRYENQKSDYMVEVHTVRIGDIAICTNPFELFTDYGIQMKTRSKALQTFVIQLVGPGTYLPSERAVRGGGYSAIVQSTRVGPEGGKLLVNRTVDMINSFWKE